MAKPTTSALAAAILLLLPLNSKGQDYWPSYVKSGSAHASFEASMAKSQREVPDPDKDKPLDYERCAATILKSISRDFPPEQVNRLLVELDWRRQDGIFGPQPRYEEAVEKIAASLGPDGQPISAEFAKLNVAKVPGEDPKWRDLHLRACAIRREKRLISVLPRLAKVVFTKHYDLGGSHYAYTEGLSDAANERHFRPGTALCVFEMAGAFANVRTLINDPRGVIRDPDVSYDGKRILFSWKKSDREDDYHLYEMTVEDGKVRQITSGLGFADYEGQYLPSGELIFNSTRCVQAVDCWWTEVSNIHTCSGDGRYLRRLAFDQVHDNFPTVLRDGRVIYTRWEYSDRGQIFVQGLFQMYPDGTNQTEFYGNNSWFPTSILHARGMPGSDRVVGILSGHHSLQKGWLAIIDPAKGRQENSGVQLIAPVRHTRAERIDAYGQDGDQFQYPYPLSERQFLVAFKPEGSAGKFGIYVIDIDGNRELLVADPAISCNQPIPLSSRPLPPPHVSRVDYRKKTGTVYMQDVYAGPGLAGIPRGTIKSLRVVAIDYRAAAINSNSNNGPAGGALISTPISIQGAWDTKTILGDATVHEDGSASFIVPSNTPVYFQALDEKNEAVQTMRSWAQLQPGESLSCVGCHENKNAAPPVRRTTLAMQAGPQKLEGWYGPPRGFSFRREIQPILDRKCVSCHTVNEPKRLVDPRGPIIEEASAWPSDPPTEVEPRAAADIKPSFSLRRDGKFWSTSYRTLANRKLTSWIDPQSEPSMLPPYHAGAAKTRWIALLRQGHYGVKLTPEEMDKFVAWVDLLVPYLGEYTEIMNERDLATYNRLMSKRHRWIEQERRNIDDFVRDRGN